MKLKFCTLITVFLFFSFRYNIPWLMIHSILVTCIDFLRRNQLLISLTLLYFFFQQTECLIRASMTLLKVPFIFPKYFFCSQQATFVKVSKVYFVVFFVCTCVNGTRRFCQESHLLEEVKPEIM